MSSVNCAKQKNTTSCLVDANGGDSFEKEIAGEVQIYIPDTVVVGVARLFSPRKAEVRTSTGRLLWKGKHGEVASFTVSQPINIVIRLGKWANDITGVVFPKRNYFLVQHTVEHILATYQLTEMLTADADNPSAL